MGASPPAIRGLARCCDGRPPLRPFLPWARTRHPHSASSTTASPTASTCGSSGIPRDDRALVAVSDARTGESFTIGVRDGERALDVFHHPYAYAATRRTLDDAPSGELEAVAA